MFYFVFATLWSVCFIGFILYALRPKPAEEIKYVPIFNEARRISAVAFKICERFLSERGVAITKADFDFIIKEITTLAES